MTISREHLSRLESLGYNEVESRFLYLVATHSGHFTARQFLTFAGQHKGCMLDRFIARLLDLGHARSTEYGRNARVLNVFSRQIYGALDKDNLRNRRRLSDELIHTRLLILDFVLAQPDLNYLETESAKLTYFHERLGIPLAILPGHIYAGIKSLATTKRYFVDRFPLFLTSADSVADRTKSIPAFTYCDPYGQNLKPFREHLRSYRAFLERLTQFNFIYASPDRAKFERARGVFNRLFGPDAWASQQELTRYFHVRKLWEEQKYNSLTREDRDLLRAGNVRYRAERFQSAYNQWLLQPVPDAGLKADFQDGTAAAQPTFRAHLLPHRYDFFVWQGGPNYRTVVRNHGSIDGSMPGAKSNSEGSL